MTAKSQDSNKEPKQPSDMVSDTEWKIPYAY